MATTDTIEDFLGPLQEFPKLIQEWKDQAAAHAKNGAALIKRRDEIIAIGAGLKLPKLRIGRSLPLDLMKVPAADLTDIINQGNAADSAVDGNPMDNVDGNVGGSAEPRSELADDGTSGRERPDEISPKPENRFVRRGARA